MIACNLSFQNITETSGLCATALRLCSFVLVVSYIGMFLLLHEVNVRALLCMISAIGFASFPFFASMGSLNWVITYQTVSAVCLKKKCELPWYNFRTPLDGEAR